MITLLGLSFGDLLSGAVIIETVFGWPGLGRYLVSGINGRDFPVVQASVLVIAIGFVVGNLITDLLLVSADPKDSLHLMSGAAGRHTDRAPAVAIGQTRERDQGGARSLDQRR